MSSQSHLSPFPDGPQARTGTLLCVPRAPVLSSNTANRGRLVQRTEHMAPSICYSVLSFLTGRLWAASFYVSELQFFQPVSRFLVNLYHRAICDDSCCDRMLSVLGWREEAQGRGGGYWVPVLFRQGTCSSTGWSRPSCQMALLTSLLILNDRQGVWFFSP